MSLKTITRRCLFVSLVILLAHSAPAALSVSNLTATGVSRTNAFCWVNVSGTNNVTNSVYLKLCYGLTDRTTNWSQWMSTNNVVSVTATGAASTNVTGLLPNNHYFYRWYSWQGTNTAFSTPSTSFWTLVGSPTSSPPVVDYFPVMSDTNGKLVAPTNFLDRNSILQTQSVVAGYGISVTTSGRTVKVTSTGTGVGDMLWAAWRAIYDPSTNGLPIPSTNGFWDYVGGTSWVWTTFYPLSNPSGYIASNSLVGMSNSPAPGTNFLMCFTVGGTNYSYIAFDTIRGWLNIPTTNGLAGWVTVTNWVQSLGYITGYVETDTLATVTARGAATPTSITVYNSGFPRTNVVLSGSVNPAIDGVYVWSGNNGVSSYYLCTNGKAIFQPQSSPYSWETATGTNGNQFWFGANNLIGSWNSTYGTGTVVVAWGSVIYPTNVTITSTNITINGAVPYVTPAQEADDTNALTLALNTASNAAYVAMTNEAALRVAATNNCLVTNDFRACSLLGLTQMSNVWVKTNGNVGIGTNAPSALLHVAGNARVDGTTIVTSVLMPSGISMTGTNINGTNTVVFTCGTTNYYLYLP